MENNQPERRYVDLADAIQNDQTANDMAMHASEKAIEAADSVLNLMYGNPDMIDTSVAARHLTIMYVIPALLHPLLLGAVNRLPKEQWDQECEMLAEHMVTYNLQDALRAYMESIEQGINQENSGG